MGSDHHSANGIQSLLLARLRLLFRCQGLIGCGILSTTGSLKLDASKHLGLPVMALDHLDRCAHVLLQPIDVGAILQPECRIGVPEAVDGALTPDAVFLQVHLDKRNRFSHIVPK